MEHQVVVSRPAPQRVSYTLRYFFGEPPPAEAVQAEAAAEGDVQDKCDRLTRWVRLRQEYKERREKEQNEACDETTTSSGRCDRGRHRVTEPASPAQERSARAGPTQRCHGGCE